jgi:hypothetical protein
MRSYRIGMCDPDPDNKAVRWIGAKSHERDLPDLKQVIQKYNAEVAGRPDLMMCLGNFPVGPRRKAKA